MTLNTITANGAMTTEQIEGHIARLYKAIETEDMTPNRLIYLASQWEAYKRVLGQYDEGAWSLMWRLRGF